MRETTKTPMITPRVLKALAVFQTSEVQILKVGCPRSQTGDVNHQSHGVPPGQMPVPERDRR